jgi:hypothetical protein
VPRHVLLAAVPLALFAAGPGCALIDAASGRPAPAVDAAVEPSFDAAPTRSAPGGRCAVDEDCTTSQCVTAGFPDGICAGCSRDSDCPSGRGCDDVCADETCTGYVDACLERCTTDAECGTGLSCESETGDDRLCRPRGALPDLSACTDFRECSSGFCYVRLGRRGCYSDCSDDDDCAPGHACSRDRVHSFPAACGPVCASTGASCGDGNVCTCFGPERRGCVPECDDASDCYSGSLCESGVCVQQPCTGDEDCAERSFCGYAHQYDPTECAQLPASAVCLPIPSTTTQPLGSDCFSVYCDEGLCTGGVLEGHGVCRRPCPGGAGCPAGQSCRTVSYRSPQYPMGPLGDVELCVPTAERNTFGQCGADADCPTTQRCGPSGFCVSRIGAPCPSHSDAECVPESRGCTWANRDMSLTACSRTCIIDADCQAEFPGGCCWDVNVGSEIERRCATAAMCG